ncbi:MAG: hypothetical protein Q8Q32_02935 [bacterium]|nr:hypothetical protein [bacterium]
MNDSKRPETGAVYSRLQELIGMKVCVDGMEHTITNDYIVVWALIMLHQYSPNSQRVVERAGSEEDAWTMVKAVYTAYNQEFVASKEDPHEDEAT